MHFVSHGEKSVGTSTFTRLQTKQYIRSVGTAEHCISLFQGLYIGVLRFGKVWKIWGGLFNLTSKAWIVWGKWYFGPHSWKGGGGGDGILGHGHGKGGGELYFGPWSWKGGGGEWYFGPQSWKGGKIIFWAMVMEGGRGEWYFGPQSWKGGGGDGILGHGHGKGGEKVFWASVMEGGGYFGPWSWKRVFYFAHSILGLSHGREGVVVVFWAMVMEEGGLFWAMVMERGVILCIVIKW